MSVWREEAHSEGREIDGNFSSDSDSGDKNAKVSKESSKNPASGTLTTPHSLSSHPETDYSHLSLPPSSRTPISDFPDDGSPFSRSGHNERSSTSTSTGAKKRTIVDDDVEDESFWKDLEVAQTLQPTQQQSSKPHVAPTQFTEDLSDVEMWAALGEVTNQSSATSAKSTSRNAPITSKQVAPDEMDIDDDDMWDIIRENEKFAPTCRPVATDPAAVVTDPAPRPTTHPSEMKLTVESEMDWNDVYAD